MLIKVLFSYRADMFPQMNISSLLRKIKVSPVRPVPVRITGKIIGRGVPGLIWSEDFVMQDDTGIIFLDYSQPIPFYDFFFGLLKAGEYTGRTVTVEGWYRRSPVPYIEIKSIESQMSVSNCYTYYAKLGISVLFMIIGAVSAVTGF